MRSLYQRATASGALSQTIDHVIHISVDGLRPDAVVALGPALCPGFHRLMIEGTFTLNARSDCDYTNTLPNHTCQMTGRAVLGPGGHGISFNSDTGSTIAEAHGSYVAGIFDVVHDNGMVTALFTGKDKFALFDRSEVVDFCVRIQMIQRIIGGFDGHCNVLTRHRNRQALT